MFVYGGFHYLTRRHFEIDFFKGCFLLKWHSNLFASAWLTANIYPAMAWHRKSDIPSAEQMMANHPCCEHHQYCRPTLSIMLLRLLSTAGRGNHHGPHCLTSLNPTPDHHPPLFVQQFACSTSNALICSFHARLLRTALSPTSNIL